MASAGLDRACEGPAEALPGSAWGPPRLPQHLHLHESLSGKTTTMSLITGALYPDEGWAMVAGFDVVKQRSQVACEKSREKEPCYTR